MSPQCLLVIHSQCGNLYPTAQNTETCTKEPEEVWTQNKNTNDKFKHRVHMYIFYQAIVVLHGGDDYKFVVVEDNGFVSSYAPRLAGGDHMIMVTVNNTKNWI